MRGRGKGSQFERDLARELSLWWTGGDRDDVFWRTSQSGGRSKTRMKSGKKTFGQYGDLQAVDPIGRPLMDLLTLELKKGYNKESAFNALDKKPIAGVMHASQWEKFVEQASTDCKNGDTPFWALIHKRDSRAAMIFFPMGLYHHWEGLLRLARPGVYLILEDGREIYGTTFEEFKKNVSANDVCHALKIIKDRAFLKKIIKIHRIVPSLPKVRVKRIR